MLDAFMSFFSLFLSLLQQLLLLLLFLFLLLLLLQPSSSSFSSFFRSTDGGEEDDRRQLWWLRLVVAYKLLQHTEQVNCSPAWRMVVMVEEGEWIEREREREKEGKKREDGQFNSHLARQVPALPLILAVFYLPRRAKRC